MLVLIMEEKSKIFFFSMNCAFYTPSLSMTSNRRTIIRADGSVQKVNTVVH